jgi:hypothetical protein
LRVKLSKQRDLLVAIDDSANGKLAVRLAGLIPASEEITTTVLHLGRRSPEAVVRSAMAATARSSELHEEKRRTAHVTMRTGVLPAESAVTREARKGYGLLALDIAKTVETHGGFHEAIARIVAMYEGLLAVVVARGAHVDSPEDGV